MATICTVDNGENCFDVLIRFSFEIVGVMQPELLPDE